MPRPLDDSLVIVLAGGAGERLYPLTKDRAKPAVYFGGPYRIIDFVDEEDRVRGFEEKPQVPSPIPGTPDLALASMGIYIFDMDVLVRSLESDALQPTTHDFGRDIIPSLIHDERVFAYRFYDEN